MYKANNAKNTDEYPILVLGDEGGVLTIAKDLKDFMHFLTYNQQPYIGTFRQPYFFDFTEETIENGNNEEYRNFVKEKFNIDPIISQKDVLEFIIKPAQDLYQEIIDNYFENYS